MDQLRLILLMQACGLDFPSVLPSRLGEVAAAVQVADQAAVNKGHKKHSYPRAVICRGYFFVQFVGGVECGSIGVLATPVE